MKKLWMIFLAILFTPSLVGPGMAREKAKKEEPAPAAKPAAEEPPEAAQAKEPQEKANMEEKKEAPKPMIWRSGGVVDAVDVKAKVLTIRQVTIHHDRSLELKVNTQAAKGLSDLKPGDLVNLWITDQVITTLTRVG